MCWNLEHCVCLLAFIYQQKNMIFQSIELTTQHYFNENWVTFQNLTRHITRGNIYWTKGTPFVSVSFHTKKKTGFRDYLIMNTYVTKLLHFVLFILFFENFQITKTEDNAILPTSVSISTIFNHFNEQPSHVEALFQI